MEDRSDSKHDDMIDTSARKTGQPARAEGRVQPKTRAGQAASEKTIGPYEILAELGRGGMGVVYRAYQPSLKRTVALKVLIAGEDASDDAITRFHREAEAVARLGHHRNIVPVYDIGSEGRKHYFAMNLVEGKTLDEAIEAGETPPKTAARIALKLALALQHAHDHGILHRDVKPANILMAKARADAMKNPKSQISNPKSQQASSEGGERPDGASGTKGDKAESGSGEDAAVLKTKHSTPNTAGIAEYEPMITDFGLARDVRSDNRVTTTGVALGTPSYMPPEQADGKTSCVDARSDVYGIGATLYEMLTGRPPFDGASVIEVLQKVILQEPKSPHALNPAVGRDLETICLKSL